MTLLVSSLSLLPEISRIKTGEPQFFPTGASALDMKFQKKKGAHHRNRTGKPNHDNP